MIEKLVKPGTTFRYATFETLFDIIKEVHEEGLKHGCRDILNKKLQKMYANISVKQIQAFVDSCEVHYHCGIGVIRAIFFIGLFCPFFWTAKCVV